MRFAYSKIFVKKPEDRIPHVTNRHRLQNKINLFRTKRNLLYIRNQSVLHCKLFPPQLQKPIS